MATHSSILAWRIPRTEEPGRLWSTGRRVRHDWSDWAQQTAQHSTRSLRNRICIEEMINPSLLYQCLLTLELVFSVSHYIFLGYQFSSVACVWLCSPMSCTTPGFPVHHQLPELVQTHVHWVGDAIQPSHPLSSPSPAFNLSQHRGLFQWVSSSHQVAKVLEFQLQFQSFQWIFSTDFLDSLISSQSKGLSRVFSNTIVQKHQFLVIIVLNSAKKCYGYNDHFGWIPKSCLYMH